MNKDITSSHTDRILIVDDTPANLQLLTNFLTEQGYTVHPASDGELALQFVQSILPDLILLDIKMPDMDGYEVCRRLKADDRTRSIPIIFISVLEDEHDKVKGFQAGGVDYITKPFRPDEVTARVRTHLRLRDLTIRLEQKVKERTEELTKANQQLLEEITERRQAEEALRKSEEKYRRIVDTANEGVWVLDADYTTVFLNARMAEMMGYRVEEMIGQSFEAFLFEEDLPDHEKRKETRRRGLSEHYERRLRHKDGQTVWTSISATPLFDSCHHFQGSFGMFTDITKRKCAEEALQEKTEELDRYFTSSLDLLCIADTDGYFHRLNPEWESALGYPVSELEGRRFLDFVHPDDMEQTLQAVSRLSDQKEVLNFVNRYRSRSGSYRWIEWRSFPSGRLIYTVARDITERKRAEEELYKLNQELEQRVRDRTAQLEAANKELEAFAYSVSHDLRAPLRHIDGFIGLLQKSTGTALDEQSRHYLANISDSAQSMGMLIDDLLSFSRMGRQEMSRIHVDLGILAQEIIRECEPDIQGRSIHWYIADLPVVRGDRAMLRMVLVNLISNALKFTRTRERAEIEIGNLEQGTEDIIYIRDNGVGFDMDYADGLFGVFKRFHRKEEFEGTGIGLANVRRIISRHGGRTWAEGKVNQGATFYFSLPRLIQED